MNNLNTNNNFDNSSLQDLTNKILKNIAGFADWKNESIITQIDKNDINHSFVCYDKLISKNDYFIFSFKDFLVKMILNIAFNLKTELDIKAETLKKLIFYYKFEAFKDDVVDENGNLRSQAATTAPLDSESLECIKNSAEFLIKIINVGLDKEKSEFDAEIKDVLSAILDDVSNKSLPDNLNINKNNLKKKINSTEINNKYLNCNNSNNNNNNFTSSNFQEQDFYSPLTSYNKQLQSYAFNLVDSEKDDFLEVYINNLKKILVKNFIPGSSKFVSDQDAFYCKTINANLIKEIKMNILLVEEENIQQANIYDESDNTVKNISSLSNFINKLFVVNKNLDCYYKNKENTKNENNVYKALIDDFFEIFNLKIKNSSDNEVGNNNGKIFGYENENENIFESTQNNINLDFNKYFTLDFNYLIYLLPGNSHDILKSSGSSNSNSKFSSNNDLSERTFFLNTDKIPNYTNNNNNNLNQTLNNNSNMPGAKRQSQNLPPNSITQNLSLSNPNICNTGFLSRYIARKDYIYRMLVSNVWSNFNYEISEDEYVNAKRYQLLKENICFYVNEAKNIFNLYLFKIELIRAPYMIFNLNRTLTNTGNDVNESVEFLFWKNLKILRKEDENAVVGNKKKGANEANLITIE